MLVTVYPNDEIRARVPAPVPEKRVGSGGGMKSAYLVNRLKVASPLLPPIEACRYPSCPVRRPGYGGLPKPTEFSARARKTISRVGGLFAPASEKRTAFLTGTLPGGTPQAFQAMAEYSAHAVHSIITRIPQLAGALASSMRWIWVWEFQKRGALHFHAVIELPDSETANKICEAWRRVWSSVLRSIAEKSGVDIFERRDGGTHRDDESAWRIDAQLAQKSPQRYLAKYLGKSEGKAMDGNVAYPTRWYGTSRMLIRELAEKTMVIETSRPPGSAPFDVSERDLDLLSYLQTVAAKAVAFGDKIKTGTTFVFYPKEGLISEIISRILEDGKEMKSMNKADSKSTVNHKIPKGTLRTPNLRKIKGFAHLRERFLADMGRWYCDLYEKWDKGERIPEEELFWLENYARELLYRSGMSIPVNALERSGTGLTDESKDTGERVDAGPNQYWIPGL